MWFVWFMWGIVGVAIIATIILLTGKGSMLVTGFNTKNAEELTKYDVKKVSRQALKLLPYHISFIMFHLPLAATHIHNP